MLNYQRVPRNIASFLPWMIPHDPSLCFVQRLSSLVLPGAELSSAKPFQIIQWTFQSLCFFSLLNIGHSLKLKSFLSMDIQFNHVTISLEMLLKCYWKIPYCNVNLSVAIGWYFNHFYGGLRCCWNGKIHWNFIVLLFWSSLGESQVKKRVTWRHWYNGSYDINEDWIGL